MSVLSNTNSCVLALAILFGASCSSVNKLALKSTSQILEKGSQKVNHEPDWTLFKEGAPANIMMIEGMSHADPENTLLLEMASKAYGGYGFGVHETLYLESKLGDGNGGVHKKRAIAAYTKGFEYGLRFLEQKGIDRKIVFSRDAAEQLPKLFDQRLGEDDMKAVFYTAQNLGGLINLQKDNVSLISRIGAVKAMMDWVCKQDMEFEDGGCHLFYAMYEASRPAMLGGDLEKGKEHFKRFIKKYPHNLLGRVSYIQFYVVPMMDGVEYARQSEVLAREFGEWEKVKNAGASGKGVEKYRENSRYNLYNAIAHERFKIIEKHKEYIF